MNAYNKYLLAEYSFKCFKIKAQKTNKNIQIIQNIHLRLTAFENVEEQESEKPIYNYFYNYKKLPIAYPM